MRKLGRLGVGGVGPDPYSIELRIVRYRRRANELNVDIRRTNSAQWWGQQRVMVDVQAR